jgi:phosphoribosyl 1,2-cyclic phosphate phosphodiesterase
LQATKLGLRQFDALILTHSHDAHTLGLGTLLKSQREKGSPLLVCAPAPVLAAVRERFDHLWTDKAYRRVLQPRPIEEAIDLWGLEVRPMRVDHGAGGTAFGYQLHTDKLDMAYIPDMLRVSGEIRQALTDLDLLVLGASHYYDGTEMWKRSVMDIMAALELIREVAPKKAILTHLSHTVEYGEVSARLSPGISLAYDGLTVEM